MFAPVGRCVGGERRSGIPTAPTDGRFAHTARDVGFPASAGKITSSGGGQHRVCLVIGTAAAPPSAVCGAMPRAPFTERSEDNMNKDVKFSTRMTSQNRAAIKVLAAKAGMSMSDYVTACCLGKRIVVIDEQKELLRQLKGIGNNLNRLTVLANMGKVQVISLDKTAQELSEVSAALRSAVEGR